MRPGPGLFFVARLMGIQFIPWPRLILHFMLNKRPGYRVGAASSILAPTINYTRRASVGRQNGYQLRPTIERTTRIAASIAGVGHRQLPSFDYSSAY